MQYVQIIHNRKSILKLKHAKKSEPQVTWRMTPLANNECWDMPLAHNFWKVLLKYGIFSYLIFFNALVNDILCWEGNIILTSMSTPSHKWSAVCVCMCVAGGGGGAMRGGGGMSTRQSLRSVKVLRILSTQLEAVICPFLNVHVVKLHIIRWVQSNWYEIRGLISFPLSSLFLC